MSQFTLDKKIVSTVCEQVDSISAALECAATDGITFDKNVIGALRTQLNTVSNTLNSAISAEEKTSESTEIKKVELSKNKNDDKKWYHDYLNNAVVTILYIAPVFSSTFNQVLFTVKPKQVPQYTIELKYKMEAVHGVARFYKIKNNTEKIRMCKDDIRIWHVDSMTAINEFLEKYQNELATDAENMENEAIENNIKVSCEQSKAMLKSTFYAEEIKNIKWHHDYLNGAAVNITNFISITSGLLEVIFTIKPKQFMDYDVKLEYGMVHGGTSVRFYKTTNGKKIYMNPASTDPGHRTVFSRNSIETICNFIEKYYLELVDDVMKIESSIRDGSRAGNKEIIKD